MAKHPEAFGRYVFVCTGKDCKKAGGKEISKALKLALRAEGRLKDTRVIRTRCTDNCKRAPVLSVMPDNRWILDQTPEETVAQCLAIIAQKSQE